MRRTAWILLFLTTALFGVCPDAAAQNARASLTGRLLDPSGARINGAKVTLRRQSVGIEGETATDADGTFRFNDLAGGEYRLSVAASGFSASTQELSLSPNENLELNVVAQPGTIVEKITVTATRSESIAGDTPVPVTVVESAELERRSLATIGDLFRRLPGATTANEGPFQVRPRIRGLESNRVLVLVDGERLNNARTSTSNSGIEIGLVDPGQIERVEIARGSGSVLYGTDALAGTINIITSGTPPRQDSGFHFSGGVNGFFSSNETGRRGSSFFAGASKRFAFRASQTLDRFDDYHTDPVPLGNGSENSSDKATEVSNSLYHGSNTQLVGRVFFNDSHSARINYERRRASDIGTPGVFGVFTAFFPFSNRDKASGRYEGRDLTKYLVRLSASVYYQKQDRNFSNITSVPAQLPFFPGLFQFSETVTKTSTGGFDLQTNWALAKNNLLTTGASFFRDRNRDRRFIERLTPNFATNPPSLTRSVDRSNSVPNAKFGDLAFFAQNEYQATRRLRFVGGVRIDKFNIDSDRTSGFILPPFFTQQQIEDLNLKGLDAGLSVDDTAVSGDFGLVFKPAAEVSLTARVGRSFREPNLFERFFTDFGSSSGFLVGNPELKPESGVNVDIGAHFRLSRIAGSFNYFNNTYTNFLTSIRAIDRNGVPIAIPGGPGRPSTPVFQTVNVGRIRIQGLEAGFEASLSIGKTFLSPFGNISYLRGDNLQRDLPLDFITPLKTVLGLRWQDGRDRVWSEYSVRVINKQERLSPQFLSLNLGPEAGFVVHDLRGGVNFRRERYTLAFTVGVDNLANRFYNEQFVFAPARGRSATFGINLRFY